MSTDRRARPAPVSLYLVGKPSAAFGMHRTAVAAASLTLAMLWIGLRPATASNDTYFPQQWGLQKVGAEQAWGVARGQGVIIGIIDSGVKLNHPDLQANLLPGWDFVDKDDYPDDGQGHGTLVAGVAAAVAGNGEGIAGVAPEAKILPVRVFDSGGNSRSDVVSTGIRWAVEEARRRG